MPTILKASALFTLAFLCGCLSRDYPATTSADASVSEFFKSPHFYQWNEIMGEDVSDHGGGLILQADGNKIYAVGWWSSGEFSPSWPEVEGMGYIQDNKVHIVFRNKTGNPKHEFYHAKADFIFSKAGNSFSCSFAQQESAKDPTIGHGKATGKLIRAEELIPDAFIRDKKITSFKKWFKQMSILKQAPGLCPIMPHRAGLPSIKHTFNGKVYYFCCQSCLEVFKQKPEL